LTKNYDNYNEDLHNAIEGVSIKSNELFPFETVESLDIPQSPLKSSEFDLKDMEEMFEIDLNSIQLYVEEVGLIEEEKKELQINDIFTEEINNVEAGVYDIERDSSLGDVGLLKDIHLYNYDYKLPYSFNLAKQSCNDIKRVCELVCNLNNVKTVRPREFIKIKMISWYLIRYGKDLYEQTLGDVIKEKNKIMYH